MRPTHDESPILTAEWEKQSAILIVWPHVDTDWLEDIEAIEQTYIQISSAITTSQKLIIVCRNKEHEQNINQQLKENQIALDNITFINCHYNDTWCRDYGPLFFRNKDHYEIRNFVFNGWGNKFNADADSQVASELHKRGIFGSVNLNDYDFVLEGGSIDTDGQGAILTTSSCLLKRHPDKDKTELERLLKEYLSTQTVHWISNGDLTGDDTDGHIDMLARFVNHETIVYSACHDKNYPNYESLNKMKAELILLIQENGEPYKLVPLEIPELKMHKEKPLPASYVNFLIINQAVLVPTYNDKQDQTALDTMKQCFPNRDIIGIDANALIKQSGSLHCATMQIPAGVH